MRANDLRELGEDVVARRDRELDLHSAGGKPQLVDRRDVRRVGDRDPEASCLRADTGVQPPPERIERDCSSTLRRDRSARQCRRTAGGGGRRARARAPTSSAQPLVEKRLGERAAARRGRVAAASRSAGTSPVGSSRSATSSASSLTASARMQARRRRRGSPTARRSQLVVWVRPCLE